MHVLTHSDDDEPDDGEEFSAVPVTDDDQIRIPELNQEGLTVLRPIHFLLCERHGVCFSSVPRAVAHLKKTHEKKTMSGQTMKDALEREGVELFDKHVRTLPALKAIPGVKVTTRRVCQKCPRKFKTNARVQTCCDLPVEESFMQKIGKGVQPDDFLILFDRPLSV